MCNQRVYRALNSSDQDPRSGEEVLNHFLDQRSNQLMLEDVLDEVEGDPDG